jgi:alkyl sulfatase BDS1-like metallo-beta-lactamase superfamily hydrolase
MKVNAQFAKDLKLDDPQDFEDAKRGFIAKPSGKILAPDGSVLKDFEAYNFLDGKAADTVNPSLWRHAQLNANYGLFKVSDGVYQLRGFDIANMTIIEGKTGWILVDPLTAPETSSAALAFARQHLGNKPVSAVVLTHAHADHFGGVLGVVTPRKWPSARSPSSPRSASWKKPPAKTSWWAPPWPGARFTSLAVTCPAMPKAMWTPAWAKMWPTEPSASSRPTC